ncbi:MAG: mechanosensitive ion channel family protein [Desulfomonile tiedjei]|nr:mechanosensitive ion channel family protein [Desulfomonile tiedjei]
MITDLVSEWLLGMGIAPLLGSAMIAVGTIIAAIAVRFLGDKISLALSRWSGLGIRTQLFDIIRVPMWMSVGLVGVLAEVHWLMPSAPVEFLVSGAAKTGLAIIWMIVLARTLRLVCSRLGGYYPNGAEMLRLIENIGMAFVGVMGGLLILALWEINVTPLLASAGIAGVIVALAAKDTLGNFFGGISVFLDRPFRVGDYIVLNTGERGKVVDIGMRSTRVLTRDDVLIAIPNSIIVNTKIVNESAPYPRMRVRIKISVAYDSDIDRVKEVLRDAAEANPLVLSEPHPRVRFRSFGDSWLEFELLCWTGYPKDKGRVIDKLNSEIFKQFIAEGIGFPFPARDVYVHQISVGREFQVRGDSQKLEGLPESRPRPHGRDSVREQTLS